MKTSFIVSACLLALVLTLVAQSPPPAQNPPGAPATSPAAQATTNPAAVNPAVPMQSPATNVPQGQQPAVPGTSVPVTLSPAPGVVTSPAAATAISPSPAASPTPEQPTGFLAGNWLIDKFHKGGPVMWPILIVSIIALTVVIERCFWWGGRWFRRDPKRIEKVFTAIENGDTTEASRLSRGSRDPVIMRRTGSRERRYNRGFQAFARITRPSPSHDVEWPQSPTRLVARRITGRCRHRDQTRRSIPRRHGHPRNFGSLARSVGHHYRSY